MDHGNRSPLGNLRLVANDKETEYFAKAEAALRVKIGKSMAELRAKLGLKPGETLADFVGLTPSGKPEPGETRLDPAVAKAIDDQFAYIAAVLLDEADPETISS
jgi:hypothetical protein